MTHGPSGCGRIRRHLRIAIAAGGALAVAGTISACTGSAPSREELRAAAQTAAEEYVAAIAEQDLESADAMTEPSVLEVTEVDDTVDVRAALPEATEPISEPWVEIVGQEDTGGSTRLTFQVSYQIGTVVGADFIELAHADGDPSEAWTVTDGLLVYGDVFADRETVPVFAFGGVELQSTDTSNVSIWGYPGTYGTEATQARQGLTVAPISVILGAEVTPPWNDSLPMLEGVSDDG
ncbi:hypothetical protein [Ruania zhangjianzhongii]|uniref:hypothetical protein n=1 Tax=Ruania zhangjianzhongii TaxID=2603206 RepID=UPI0011C9AD4E|nr:hypothetical protein [Ruania zhangjianzhongii]